MKQWTAQQEQIFDVVRMGGGNVVVEALAGTGKSSTAVGCLQQGLRGKVGFVAFNSHIAEELQSRLPPHVPACTLHSLGLQACKKAFGRLVVDDGKLGKLARELLPDAYPSVRRAAEQLAKLCKYTLTPEKDYLARESLIEHYGLDIDDRDQDTVYRLANDLIERSAAMTDVIDYDDMVWFPIRHNLIVDQFDLLLVDEAQDLNRAQQALARAATVSGRLGAIGDRFQAIYGFTGADNNALPRLSTELGATVLPLTVTWRCPTSHVKIAQNLVPALEAAPHAVDGVVKTMARREIIGAVRPGDLVISRKNAPLVGLTMKLILAGVPAMMRGREIGRGLLMLIGRLKADNLAHLIDRIEEHRDWESRRLIRKRADSAQLEALNDRCDCLGQLASQVASLEELAEFINTKFDDRAQLSEQVVLSSVHRAKGLESHTVYVLDPESLPLVRKDTKPWQLQQEHNICYIACTRSKHTLVFESHIPDIYRS